MSATSAAQRHDDDAACYYVYYAAFDAATLTRRAAMLMPQRVFTIRHVALRFHAMFTPFSRPPARRRYRCRYYRHVAASQYDKYRVTIPPR